VDDLTKEFIAESQEGLDRMERCLTELEMRPNDAGLLGEIFRAVHTIKGTTGFLSFDRLEKLAHAGEHLLGALRDGRLTVTSELISGLLHLLDGLRAILGLIEETGGEGTRSGDEDGELIAELALLNGAMPPAEIEPEMLNNVIKLDEEVVRSEIAAGGVKASGAPSTTANSERNGAGNDKTLRIDVDVLNRMMNLVGELVLTRNQMLQSDAAAANFPELARRLDS
jgi:two-component system chemotaxis sensor kinase CheA